MSETLATIRARHEAELVAAVRAALERNGWRVADAARELGVKGTMAVYRIVQRDAKLARDLERHGHERGRPAKVAAGLAGDTQPLDLPPDRKPKGTAH